MKIKVNLNIGYSNANREDIIEIPDIEFEGMSEVEKEDYISDYVEEWSNNYIDLGWEIID